MSVEGDVVNPGFSAVSLTWQAVRFGVGSKLGRQRSDRAMGIHRSSSQGRTPRALPGKGRSCDSTASPRLS